ncbi:MAG: universal stress protein, partial [Peptococcaceae bacterium]|nr:universal stress protein [Peptococcaceae bacterium]
IVGARGRGAVKRFLMGSVSTHLVANLDCPVMVVKEKNA